MVADEAVPEELVVEEANPVTVHHYERKTNFLTVIWIDEEATDRPAGAEREEQITCFQIAGTYFAPFECLAVVVAAVVAATSSYATVIRQYWYYSN